MSKYNTFLDAWEATAAKVRPIDNVWKIHQIQEESTIEFVNLPKTVVGTLSSRHLWTYTKSEGRLELYENGLRIYFVDKGSPVNQLIQFYSTAYFFANEVNKLPKLHIPKNDNDIFPAVVTALSSGQINTGLPKWYRNGLANGSIDVNDRSNPDRPDRQQTKSNPVQDQRKKDGLCLQCGDAGTMKAMACFCNNGHGKIFG